MKKLLGIFIISFLALAAVGITSARGQFFLEGNPLVGKTAPDFTLATLANPKENFTKFRDGKNTILFFWATWCPHCRAQLSALQEKAAELKRKEIVVILVDLGEDPKAVRSFIDKKGVKLPVFLDQGGTVAEEYSVVGIPMFFLVDKKGVVRNADYVFPTDYESFFQGGEKK